MYSTTSLLLGAALLPFAIVHAEADGLIVPFTSKLPQCSWDCGPLYDAQGACTPPVTTATNDTCFCDYSTLQPFYTTTAGVCDNACTTDSTGLTDIKNWFDGFCDGIKSGASATTSGSSASATSSSSAAKHTSSGNNSWISTHARWVIMLVIVVVGLAALWIGGCIWHRRWQRKKDRAMELAPPVAWGPHQMQGATGGYGQDAAAAEKNATAAANASRFSTADNEKKGGRKWLRKSRFVS